MNKNQLMPGWIWCDICNAPAADGICTKHMTEKTVTLSRYDAKTFYDVAVMLGIEPAISTADYKDVIHELAEMVRAGKVYFSPAG